MWVALGIVVVIAVIIGVVFAMRGSQPERSAGQAAPTDTDAGRADKKPAETKKADSKKADSKETAPKAGDAKAGDAKAEAKKAEAKKADAASKSDAATADAPPAKPAADEGDAAPAASQSAAAEAPAPEAKPAAAEPKKEAAPAARSAEVQAEHVAALKKGLASTRGGFIARLARLFGAKAEIDPALLDEMQEVLITADVGVKTSEKLLAALRAKLERSELATEEAVWGAIRAEAQAILGPSPGGIELKKKPTTILVVGVNGVGKTTTIGKLASRYHDAGKKVVLAAGDTFRAAAVLQLNVWGQKVGCTVVKGKDRADPGSVIFDAIKKAQEESADVVIADTAGRLHTKSNLMEELKKVVRTAEKALEAPVDEILLVLDSTTGQNAIQQAQLFKDAIPVSGIALTKLDGTAKGGVVLGIVDEHKIPVRYVGVGERIEDLHEFDAEAFVSALFAKPDEETAAA